MIGNEWSVYDQKQIAAFVFRKSLSIIMSLDLRLLVNCSWISLLHRYYSLMVPFHLLDKIYQSNICGFRKLPDTLELSRGCGKVLGEFISTASRTTLRWWL